MKRLLFALMVLVLSLGLAGCYQFMAKHPEKSNQEYYEDQAYCEKKAREYTMERREQMTYKDETDHARRCMRELGWEYYLRRPSSTSETKTAE
ncbi:MAG: hypothetical protein HUK40_16865 [Desulfobacter sp.]|nr:hypothetical protein [Desulfobacter sp.]WDP86976.1 MAG: hypothetical protein HUN05_19115 [Desulfobacter sp.]